MTSGWPHIDSQLLTTDPLATYVPAHRTPASLPAGLVVVNVNMDDELLNVAPPLR
jgi:hypothetical protein